MGLIESNEMGGELNDLRFAYCGVGERMKERGSELRSEGGQP